MSLWSQGEQVYRGKMNLNSFTCKKIKDRAGLATRASLVAPVLVLNLLYKLLSPSPPPVLTAFCGRKIKETLLILGEHAVDDGNWTATDHTVWNQLFSLLTCNSDQLNLVAEGSRSLSDSLAIYVLLNIICKKLSFGPACKRHTIHGLELKILHHCAGNAPAVV